MLTHMPDCGQKGGFKVWHLQHTNEWWAKTLGNIWHMQLDLKAFVFLWSVYVGGVPLVAKMKDRGYTDGKCPRCKVRQETARHTFWFFPLVLEWWRQLRATVLSRTGINLQSQLICSCGACLVH